MKNVICLNLIFYIFLITGFVNPIFAVYTLPYPSYMPGNRLYPVSRILDTVNKYWHFGNIAQYKYHLGLSDKYLVEAKTLFEYGQYLLADDALKRSNKEIPDTLLYIEKAQKEGKDMTNQIRLFKDALNKHVQVLENLTGVVPQKFQWVPEKGKPTDIHIGESLQGSVELRQNILTKLN